MKDPSYRRKAVHIMYMGVEGQGPKIPQAWGKGASQKWSKLAINAANARKSVGKKYRNW
jgi:hypothetical protein